MPCKKGLVYVVHIQLLLDRPYFKTIICSTLLYKCFLEDDKKIENSKGK